MSTDTTKLERQTIQLRRSEITKTDKSNSDIVLKDGEPFFTCNPATQTYTLYIGDGITQLKNLPMINKLSGKEIVTIINSERDTHVELSDNAKNVTSTINKTALSEIFTNNAEGMCTQVRESAHADNASHADRSDIAEYAKMDMNGKTLSTYIASVEKSIDGTHTTTTFKDGSGTQQSSFVDINQSVFLLSPGNSWSGGPLATEIVIGDDEKDITNKIVGLSYSDFQYLQAGDTLIQNTSYYVYRITEVESPQSSTQTVKLSISCFGQIKGEKGDTGAQGIRGYNMYSRSPQTFERSTDSKGAWKITDPGEYTYMKNDVCIICSSVEEGEEQSDNPKRGEILVCNYAEPQSASVQISYWNEAGNVRGFKGDKGDQGVIGNAGPSGRNQWLLHVPNGYIGWGGKSGKGLPVESANPVQISIDNESHSVESFYIEGFPTYDEVREGDVVVDSINQSIWEVSGKTEGTWSSMFKITVKTTKTFVRGSQMIDVPSGFIDIRGDSYVVNLSSILSVYPYYLNYNDTLVIKDSESSMYKLGTTFIYTKDNKFVSENSEYTLTKTNYTYQRYDEQFKKDLLLAAHPVGSYYWSNVSTSPATLFGGSWTQITGKFILAAGDGYNNGATGGEKTVKLEISNMPSHSHSTGNAGEHTHSFWRDWDGAGGTSRGTVFSNAYPAGNGHTLQATTSNGKHNHGNTGSTGSGTGHNNMPPYQVAYCWYRTA